MIISCEKCATRFQVPDERITDAGVRARCSRCAHVFTVTRQSGVKADESAPMPAASQPFSSTGGDRKTEPFPFGGGRSATAGAFPASQNPFLRAGSTRAPLSDVAPTPQFASSQFPPSQFPPSQPPPSQFPSAPFPSTGAPPAHPFAPPPSAANPFDGPRPPTPAAGNARKSTEGHLSASSFPRPSSTSMKRAEVAPPPSPMVAPTFAPPPPTKPVSDPFAPPSQSPFATDASPFGVPSMASRFGPAAGAAGFDDGESSSAQPAARATDPFSSGPFAQGAHGSPFGGGRPHDPFATTPPVAEPPEARAAQSKLADELFGGDAPFRSTPATSSPPPAMPPPPPVDASLPPGFDADAPSSDPFSVPHSGEMPATSVHDVPDILREQAKPEPVRATPRRPRARRPLSLVLRPLVKPIAQAANAVVLVAFLGAAVVLARGGTVDDLTSGRFVEILLGFGGGLVGSDAAVVRDVVVARYPVKAAPDLVVVTGVVENRGDAPLKGARIEVTFDGSERVFVGAPGKGPSPSDVREASDAIALFARPTIPDDIPAASSAPFTILASGLTDGARARVRLVDEEAPGAPR